MKISAKQKELNRQRLIRSAVEVMGHEGFEGATLRQISAGAGLSDPVIYSYFPNKQSLLYGYFAWTLEQALIQLSSVPKIGQLPFAEQVQLLMETHFEVLEKDRKFVTEIFPLVFVTGLGTAQEALSESRDLFKAFVGECMEGAIHAGEYPAPPFKEMVISVFWDFHIGIMHYWLNDKSEMQAATSELLQNSLAVLNEVFKSAFLPRLADLAYFLIRTHLLTPSVSVSVNKERPKILDLFAGLEKKRNL